jgi:hypothetical protein
VFAVAHQPAEPVGWRGALDGESRRERRKARVKELLDDRGAKRETPIRNTAGSSAPRVSTADSAISRVGWSVFR